MLFSVNDKNTEPNAELVRRGAMHQCFINDNKNENSHKIRKRTL